MTEVKVEAPTGFPGECPTNAYILDGFGHVVYMVSTVAPGHGGTEASILSRLRNAERELRSQSPLVFLDVATKELFTFYRLVDFQKDGKNIYGRLGLVLRQNKCINSFKSFLKAMDIIKVDNTRVRGLLFAALFIALRNSLLNDNMLVPLGMRTFLRAPPKSAAHFCDKPAESTRKVWDIEMVDLQLLAHGQLLVVNISRKFDDFCPLLDVLEVNLADDGTLCLNPGIVCLAPSGQMARYTDGEVITTSLSGVDVNRPGTARSEQQNPRLQEARRKSWMEQTLIWMAEQGVPDIYLQDKYWVEIEILLSRKEEQGLVNVDDSEAKTENFVWHRVLWPAQLCFYTQPPPPRTTKTSKTLDEDPVAFVQDWLLKSDERAREIARMGSANRDEVVGLDTQPIDNLDEDSGFGSTPHMHNAFSTGLPPGQMMYPTPPDMPFTQPTPGMSSMDGLGLTPAEATRSGPAIVEQQNDVNMLDRMDTSGVGTGTYDEDLFEDLPTHRFGTAGATDEPDWDFFEQQNAENGKDNTQSDDVEMKTGVTPGNNEEESNSPGLPIGNAESMLPPRLDGRASTQNVNSSSPPDLMESPSTKADPGTIAMVTPGDVESMLTVDVPSEDPTSLASIIQSHLPEQPSEVEVWKKPALPAGRGRRRSLFDSSEDVTATADHDARYTANGTFWFDAVSKDPHKKRDAEGSNMEDLTRNLSRHRSSSSESPKSEASSFYEIDNMDLSEEGTISSAQKWTEYEQYATALHLGPTTEELDQIHIENCKLLALLRPITLDHTWIPGTSPGPVDSIPGPSKRASISAMAAQILVDQLAQTSIPCEDEDTLQKNTASDVRFEKWGPIDSPYGRLEPVTFSGLTKSNESVVQSDSTRRLQSLEQHQLSLSRTDKDLIISSTAFSLWEHLNLQPKGDPKDVQSFCIHPASANLEMGCATFLERLGETYTNCNLGDHSIGEIAGMSNNGLVSWSNGDNALQKLEQCCERLGTALARLPPTSDNIVIYMIMMPESDLSPLSLVQAFCILFEAYGKACNKQHSVELGLQIIPFDFVASPDTLVVRSPEEYLKLAVEVYNRFPSTAFDDRRAYCASAIVLAESPRRRIRFDMAGHNNPSSEIGTRCLHVSYSYSQNQRWIVAAWTDERGFRALTMCYSVKGAGRSKSKPRSEIIRDIWEVSLDLMVKERHRWRLVVARDGFYEISEINEWTTQFNNKTGTNTCSLVLIAVDLNPTLVAQTPMPSAKTAQGATPQQPLHNYSTPVSTPQASTTSPDQYLNATPTPSGSIPMNAATPPEVSFDPTNEPDLTVQDPTEEAWSVVLPFGLNQSHENITCRPAMLSGFLLKRQGLRDEDGLARLGVHLIHTSTLSGPLDADEGKRKAVVAAREELLRDIIGQFRGLVTLAKTRGCTESVHNVVPWHVATAVKGARVLNKWM